MKIAKMIVISALVSVIALATVTFAGTTGTVTSNSMPMMQGQQGNMPMMQGQQGNMPMMQMMGMMQQRHVVMDEHMRKIETHMQNIEALLQRLVDAKEK